jgi:hypothetical protein
MSTFSGASFQERKSGGALVPIHGATGLVGSRPKASASGNPVIDRGGTTLYQLQLPVSCGSADFSGLRGAVGSSGSLVYAGGTVTAALVELSDAQIVKDGADVYWASLNFIVATGDTTITTPALGVTVAGGTVSSDVLSVVTSHGIDQNAGQASITFPARPSAATEGAAVTVSMGAGAVFEGTVTGRSWEHFPTGVALDCRDRMEYMTYPYGGTEREYASQTLGTVWQNLFEAMGNASVNGSIEDPGWTVGITESLIFRKGEQFLPFIRESANLAGYVAFTKGVDSAFYIRPLNYGVTGGGTHTLTEGVNILSARREISRDGIYNGVQVDGLTYEGASVSVFVGTANSDVRDPPGTISMRVQSNLIESESRGTIVALEQLSQHNFKPQQGVITLPGTPIEPMDTLVVTHADLEMTGATVAAAQVEQRFDSGGWVTTVRYRKLRA